MIPITRPELPDLDEYTALLKQIWASRMLSNFARFSKELEAIASDYLGVGVRAVASGDIGLTIAISALGVTPGSTCLVPSFTFNSTINAVLWNGLVPVFVDMDPETFNIDAVDARHKAEASGAELIIATHVFGNPVDVEALSRLAADTGARLMFDSAQSYGSSWDGQKIGGLADVEVFSLSGTKPVTTAEGGLVASRDEELLKRIDYFRAYGFQHDYNSVCQGLNGKMSELHAALGTLTLPTIDASLDQRDEQIAIYKERLAGCESIRFQRVRDEDRSTYKDLAVLFESTAQRDAVEAALAEREVQTKRYFFPCHQQTAFRPFALEPLPVTEDIYSRILSLPLYPSLRNEQIEVICDRVVGALSATPAGV